MRVITYVDGLLTVINGDNYFSKVSQKPDFIPGVSFYYEPTIKQMDGEKLSEDLIRLSEDFIDNFVFETVEVYNEPVNENVYKKYVDVYGNYVFTNTPKENYIEIENDEPTEFSVYDFENKTFFKAITIKKIDDTVAGCVKINDNNNEDYYYGNYSNYTKEICDSCQIYDKITKSFNLNIALIKKNKAHLLNIECLDYIRLQNADVGNIINAVGNSWLRQELEVKAYVENNNIETPFIDSILLGRNAELQKNNRPLETKEELINKQISKIDSYKDIYGKALGKLSILTNMIEEAQDYETIKNINW